MIDPPRKKELFTPAFDLLSWSVKKDMRLDVAKSKAYLKLIDDFVSKASQHMTWNRQPYVVKTSSRNPKHGSFAVYAHVRESVSDLIN